MQQEVRFKTIACPACCSLAFRKAWTCEELSFGKCSHCGLEYMNPMPVLVTSGNAGSSSTITAPAYNAGLFDSWQSLLPCARAMAARRLVAYESLLGRRPRYIVEIGCASGAFWVAYSECGVSYQGYDINPEMVTFARDHGIQAEVLDVASLCAPGGAGENGADVVFGSQVLEHCMAPRDFVLGACSLIRGDGILHLDVPNGGHLGQPFKKLLRKRKFGYGGLTPYEHCIAYGKSPLLALLSSCVSSDVRIWGAGVYDKTWGSIFYQAKREIRSLAMTFSPLYGGSFLVATARKGKIDSSGASQPCTARETRSGHAGS